MNKLVFRCIEVVFGLLIFSFGIHLTIQAGIGLAPWDCLGMGISYHTPFSYGSAMTVMSVLILCIDILLKESIGFGTVIDAFCTGYFINFFINHCFFHPSSLIMSILMIIAGLAFAALGQFFYMEAGLGCGPRDAFLVGVGKRLQKITIGTVNIIIMVTVFVIGFLLGGPAGIGTLISVFSTGIIMDFVFKLLHFEPRNIHHETVIESIKSV